MTTIWWLVRVPGADDQLFDSWDTARLTAQKLANEHHCDTTLVQIVELVMGTFYPSDYGIT